MKRVLEWGAVIIVFLVAWRWLEAFINNLGAGNTIQSSNYYAPGYPYQPYGIAGYQAVGGVYSPGTWQGGWNGRIPRGYPGGSQRW